MAKIDKLITMMAQRDIQCAMLIADKPGRIFAAGQEGVGPVIEAAKLSAIVTEITPENLRPQLEQRGSFLFPYQSEQGAFDIGVRYKGDVLQVTIAHHIVEPAMVPAKGAKSLAVPNETSEGGTAVARVGIQKPRLSPLAQIAGLSLLATLIGFSMIILILRAAAPLNPAQLAVIRWFWILWGTSALVWAAGCIRVATSRSEMESLLPPGYNLTPAEKLQQALAKVPDFVITQQFIEPTRHSAIAVDENARRICFITVPTHTFHEAYLEQAKEVMHAYRAEHNVKYVAPDKVHRKTRSKFPGYDPESDTRCGVYPYRAILESRVLEDGNTLMKTARTSPVGSALLDNLLKSKAGSRIDQSIIEAGEQKQFKTIDLRILTNDQAEPVHMLHFLHVQAKDAGPAYRNAMRQAEHCHEFMSDLVNALDTEDIAAELEQQRKMQSEFLKNIDSATDTIVPPSLAREAIAATTSNGAMSSVVDELQKLVDLLTHAAITQEEFDSLKARLLAG